MSDDDLDRLMAAHLDDTLDAESARRLHELLRGDEQARRLLLSAACQASALPRIALADGLAHVASPAAPRQVRRWPTWATAALAATLAISLALWWHVGSPIGDGVRIAGPPGLMIERAGGRHPGADDPWLRAGDRIIADGGPARLSWTAEGTSIELAAGSRAVIDALGTSKRLRLDSGSLRAEVAPQPAGGGLAVVTPFGAIEVVGTRFHVEVREHASVVAVEHGSVRLTATATAPPVTLTAGYVATVDGAAVSAPGPLASLPSPGSAATAPPRERVRLDADGSRPGSGWEGEAMDGVIRGVRVAGNDVVRVTTPPRRPAGYLPLDAGFRCTLRLSVAQPTTLAVLLVCDHPSGGEAWVGNLQSERVIPAGEQEVTVTRADLRLVTVGSPPPVGSRVVAAAVMCWGPATELRLRWIEFSR